MATKKFTDRSVRALECPPPKQQIDVWDESLERFGLRVSWTGKKTWVVLYRHHHRSRRLTLGSYPAMSLADARERARKALTAADDGHDPATQKFAATNAKTFTELCAEYMKRHAIPKKKTWKEDQRNIDRDLLPRWRHSIPSEITRGDVRAVVESVYDRGAHVHANRVLAVIRKIFNFAIERDWLEHNPCHMVKRPGKEHARDRVLSPEEVRRFWEATDVESPPIRAAFRLRLLTAQRGGEVLHMRWGDIDFVSRWWTIPAEFAKNGLSHRVLLNVQAVTILKDLHVWQEQRLVEVNVGRAKKHEEPKVFSDWVFPSRWYADDSLEWTRKATARIRDLASVDFRPHDLRRTAASLMTGSGISRVVVQKILNHVETGVTAVYDRHSYDNEKRVALDAWGRQVAAMVSEEYDGSNVLVFNRG